MKFLKLIIFCSFLMMVFPAYSGNNLAKAKYTKKGCSLLLQNMFQNIKTLGKGESNKKNAFYVSMNQRELLEEINSLQEFSRTFSSLRGINDPAVNVTIDRKLYQLEELLSTGNEARAKDDLHGFFKHFEFNRIDLRRAEIVKNLIDEIGENSDKSSFIDGLEQAFKKDGLIGEEREAINIIIEDFDKFGNLKDYRNFLKKDINKKLIVFGDNYDEYHRTIERLNEILEDPTCDGKCKEIITDVINDTGIKNSIESKVFKDIIGKYKKRASLEDLEVLLTGGNRRLAYVVRERKRAIAEAVATLRSILLSPSLLNFLFRRIYNIWGVHKFRLIKIFRPLYDYQASILYYPKMQQVLKTYREINWKGNSSVNTTSVDNDGFFAVNGHSKEKFPEEFLKAYSELQTQNSSVFGHDELLITYARRVDYQGKSSWKAFGGYAKEHDPDFHKRMIKAQKKAVRRGDYSLTYRKSYIARAMYILLGGTPIYFYDEISDKGWEAVTVADEFWRKFDTNNDGTVNGDDDWWGGSGDSDDTTTDLPGEPKDSDSTSDGSDEDDGTFKWESNFKKLDPQAIPLGGKTDILLREAMYFLNETILEACNGDPENCDGAIKDVDRKHASVSITPWYQRIWSTITSWFN